MLNLFRKKFPEQEIKIVNKTLTTTIEEKEAEERRSAISRWFHLNGKKLVATAALVVVLATAMGHCSCENNAIDENDLPNPNPNMDQMEEEKEPVEQVEIPEQNGIIGLKPIETEPVLEPTETELEQTPVLAPTETVKNQTPVVKKPEIKTPVVEEIHEHQFGQWEAFDANTEQRTCECGEVETREHSFSYTMSYQALPMEGKHVKQVIGTCGTCGVKVEEQTEEFCHSVVSDYDSNFEFRVCNECGRTSTRKHVLDEGTPGEKGTTIYHCSNEGCSYEKEVKPRKDKDKTNSSTKPDDSTEQPDRDHNTDNSGNEGIGSEDKIEFPDESSNTKSKIQTDLSTLYVMREFIVGGITYVGPMESKLETANQYVLKA